MTGSDLIAGSDILSGSLPHSFYARKHPYSVYNQQAQYCGMRSSSMQMIAPQFAPKIKSNDHETKDLTS